MATKIDIPASHIDLWTDDVLSNPYPHYAEMRDLGPIVWLTKNECWGAFRYTSARHVLGDPEVFSSAQGVMLNDDFNKISSEAGVILCTDDPIHRNLRRVFQRPLTPAAVGRLRDRLTEV